MFIQGYTNDELNKLRERLLKVRNQSLPIVRLTPKEGVCGLDMVDIAYRIFSKEAEQIFAQKDWFDKVTFDPERLTVGQILSVWDEVVNLESHS